LVRRRGRNGNCACRQIIRFDTTTLETSPSPDISRHLLDEDRDDVEQAKNRAQIFGRIRGSGAKRPVMLLAHMDVVSAERARWTHDPFAGDVADGYLYGRGAIDDKGMLAANLMTMLLLKRTLARTGGTLARDVVFLATSDEEAGGEWGMGWLVENHPDKLAVEYALNEGGRTRVIGDGRAYLAVQSAEKISHVVTVTAHGSAGHAAIPLRDNAAVDRASADVPLLRRLAEHGVLTEITRHFFARLAEIWPNAIEKKAMLDLVSGGAGADGGAAVL
jgi:acetylornithine deacetylase/succinyl-diaminopimelate desuccinylase-like protein